MRRNVDRAAWIAAIGLMILGGVLLLAALIFTIAAIWTEIDKLGYTAFAVAAAGVVSLVSGGIWKDTM